MDDDEAEKEKRPSMEDWERGGGTTAEDDAKLLSGSTVLRLVVRWSPNAHLLLHHHQILLHSQ